MGNGVPVAEITPGEVEGVCSRCTGLDALAVEVPEHTHSVVRATEADVELSDLVPGNAASVLDIGADGKEDIVETIVAASVVGRTCRETRLSAAVIGVGWEGVVGAVQRVLASGAKVGAVETRVDVGRDKVHARCTEVVGSPVADGAIHGRWRSVASGWSVSWSVARVDLKVGVREGGV